MQINLQNNFFKEFLKYLGWILLFISLWFKGCSKSTNEVYTEQIIVPKTLGVFEPQLPVHESIQMAKKRPEKVINKPLNESYIIENKIIEMTNKNEAILAFYEKANDSLKKELYKQSTSLNKFSTKFEDENLSINIDGIVQGKVKEVTPSYTIKEKKVEVAIQPKETVFRLLGGLEVGNNTKLDDFKVKANLMLQNRKGHIISGSFDTNQTIWIGYHFSIFDIKR